MAPKNPDQNAIAQSQLLLSKPVTNFLEALNKSTDERLDCSPRGPDGEANKRIEWVWVQDIFMISCESPASGPVIGLATPSAKTQFRRICAEG